MSAGDKFSAGMDKAKGKVEETLGKARGDKEQEARGHADQAKGATKQAFEKAKDTVKDVIDDAKDEPNSR